MVEHEPRPVERIRLMKYEGRRVVGVVVFGRSGTGQSTALNGVADALGISPEARVDAGQLIRERSGQTAASLGWGERPPETDQDVDDTVKRTMNNSTSENPAAINGKVAGLIGLRYQIDHPDTVIFRVLITCERAEAARRIYCRELEQLPIDIQNLAVRLTNGEISQDEHDTQLDEFRRILKETPDERIREIIKDKQDKKQKTENVGQDSIGS